MLFEYWERKHIIEFYKNPSYWEKSIVVCRFEMAKAKRDFCRDMKRSWLFKTIIKYLELIIK